MVKKDKKIVGDRHNFVSTIFNYMSTITNMATVQHFHFISDKFNVVESVVTEIIPATGR